jgi:opacity protein-like surface antigen
MRILAVGALFLIALALPGGAAAQRHPQLPQNEFAFGLGWAQSLESSVFNLGADDIEGGSGLGFEIAYYHNLSPAWALGLHAFGYSTTLSDIVLVGAGGEQLVTDFDLHTYNLGARLRWTFARGTISPYGFAGVGYSLGSVQSAPVGSLSHDGFAVSGGAGAALKLSPYVSFALEALLSTGWSSWDRPPFRNSESDDFDPGMFGLLGTLVFAF